MTAEITMKDHPDGTDYRVIVRHGDPAARDLHEKIGFVGRLGLGHRTTRRARREPGGAVKIVLTEFVTLDGVSQGPGSPTEDTSDGFTRGGWLVPYLDEHSSAGPLTGWVSPTVCCSDGGPTRRSLATGRRSPTRTIRSPNG